MRINRLLEMITLLLNRRTVTATEFARRFEISTRTVYRDVEELSSAGVPIYMNRGKGGGISLLEDFTLDKTLITQQETDSLLMAVRTLQATNFPDIDRFLEKLEAHFQPSDSRQWIEVDFSPWGSTLEKDDLFNLIRHAILKQICLEFEYINLNGEKRKREVYPLKLLFKSAAWYLWGYCLDRKDFRTFRLSRIIGIKPTSKTFSLTDLPVEPVGKHQDADKKLHRVRLRFSAEAANRIFDGFSDRFIQPAGDGGYLVGIEVAEDEWITGIILSYGALVKVLEPASLREKVTTRLRKALELYS